ncbi:fumarylacetoacetate hydrolase family protein [Aliamphritea spongicola]|uniref:fumarylacetoacetate hydrolase family protein n=1 Tax=Aliamphritea spongicola TaxID=707589 RepID=UPI00196A9293|nr:fumarylacetoacetate hydrolase family protein [Aliamphritea spongicola]MBN3562736.1 fumarylacetoacetate hydrolase family protein [Aliamphritea spongicola]
MKLASLKGGRDGRLVVVNTQMDRCIAVPEIAVTLQSALDHWSECAPQLARVFTSLENGDIQGEAFQPENCDSPLPRAFHWADGSAYVNHVELVRKARNAEIPDSFWVDPLMYQGGSDAFIGPRDDIEVADEAWGIDFEAEVAVVLDDVPMGVSPEAALQHIQLVMLVNDVSLRNLIPGELAKGFGFYQSKPSSAFSPVAVTPGMLGDAWQAGKLHLPLRAILNGELVGEPNAGVDMIFDFGQLIAHAAKSRPLSAGTIIGSGTVSNNDRSSGSCCLAEVRMLEIIAGGKPVTEFMKFGDRIQIDMQDAEGHSIFGEIDQKVSRYVNP